METLLLLLLAPLLLEAAPTATANTTQLDEKTGWPRCEPGGWYTVAHGEYCDRYYTCQHGAPFLGQCEDGLAYQPRAGCRLLHLVNCSGRPRLQPARGHGDCPRLNGVYGSTCSAAYTLCVSGTATPATCAHGYLFDGTSKACRRPRNRREERCAQGPQHVAEQPPDTTTAPPPPVSTPANDSGDQQTATQPPPPSDQQPYYYYYQQQPYYYQYQPQPSTTTQEPYYLYYTQPYYTPQYYWSTQQNGDWYSSGPPVVCTSTPVPLTTRSPPILVSGFLSPVKAAASAPQPGQPSVADQPTTCAPDTQVSAVPGFSCPANDPFPYGDHSRHEFPGSCRLFIMCLRGGSHKVGGCPPGYAFSTMSGNCELATAVPGCGGPILAS